MAFFLLVRRAIGHGLAPGFQHPLSIIGMKHTLPTLASRFFLSETHEGEPLRVAEIQRAIGRPAPDLLRDCVNDKPQVVFAAPYTPFFQRTLDYFHKPILPRTTNAVLGSAG